MGLLVAIGGGSLGSGETRPIDEWIVRSSRVNRPRCLFIPTASGDAQDYGEEFRKVYGRQLGAQVDILNLLNGQLTADEIVQLITTANLIYVGGGDTEKMMAVLHRYNLGHWLRIAYNHGTLVSGISAGGICWFESGFSERLKDEGKFGQVHGVGLMGGLFIPHYNGDNQVYSDEAMLKLNVLNGWAVEDGCALVVADQQVMALPAVAGRQAYVLRAINGKLIKRAIEANSYRPISEYFRAEE